MNIRHINPEDAEAYRKLYLALDKETPYRLHEAGEREDVLQSFTEEIERFMQNQTSTILVAQQADGELVGYLQAIGRPQRRLRHVVSVNVAILQKCTGQGLGAKLFAVLEEWAKEQGVKRLDLTVMKTNPNAEKLYQRLGFVPEGVKARSILVEGKFVDEVYMAKWIG